MNDLGRRRFKASGPEGLIISTRCQPKAVDKIVAQVSNLLYRRASSLLRQ